MTIELPRNLLIAAKQRAAALRRPLRQLIEDVLRRELETAFPKKKNPRKKIRWVVSNGGLPPNVDVLDRDTFNRFSAWESAKPARHSLRPQRPPR